MIADFQVHPEELGKWLVVAITVLAIWFAVRKAMTAIREDLGVREIREDLEKKLERHERRIDLIEARTAAQYEKLTEKFEHLLTRK